MPRESYSACVSRHLAVIEEAVIIVCTTTDPVTKENAMKLFRKSLVAIELETEKRIDKSSYEAERRDGKQLVETAMIVMQRRG